MERNEKQSVVDDLHEKMSRAKLAILAEPKAMDVSTVTELRRKFRLANVDYKVVKNTLATRAAKGTSVEPVAERFAGPTALILSYDDVVAPAKILADFMKDKDSLSVRAAVVDGKVVDSKSIAALAKLPGLLELRGTLVGMIARPATQLAQILAAPAQQLARVIGAYRDQQAGQGEQTS